MEEGGGGNVDGWREVEIWRDVEMLREVEVLREVAMQRWRFCRRRTRLGVVGGRCGSRNIEDGEDADGH